ncbi:MAG: isoprenylcysteine carboxylmethyltransferase family protein [Nanoarchaeota archaeon]
MTWKLLTIVFAWLTFLCFWVAGIFIYKPPVPRQRDKRWSPFLVSVVLITLMAELLAGKYLLNRFDLPSPIDSLSEIIGAVLLISGLSFAIWARIRLGRFWSGSIAFIEGQPIVKDGPYSIVRHPIYTGVIMMIWGSLLLEPFGFVLLIAVLGTLLLARKARLEERLLERHLGDKYSNYKKDVECSFIPG